MLNLNISIVKQILELLYHTHDTDMSETYIECS